MKRWNKLAVLFIAALFSFTGCHQPEASSSLSAQSGSSSEGMTAVSSGLENAASGKDVSSPAPSQSAPVSSQIVQEATAKLSGTTILDVKNNFSYTFILTAEKKVYLYGVYQEKLKELADITKTYQDGEVDLFELNLPEPIVRIEPYAALGESGTLYLFLYPNTLYWRDWPENSPKTLYTVNLGEKIKDFRYSFGDYFVVTESGKLYSIGELTLYGQPYLENQDLSKRMVPVQAVVPEAVEEVEVTWFTVFIRGKSGNVYYAYRHTESTDYGMPPCLKGELPYPYTASLFKKANVTGIQEIAIGADDSGHDRVYLLKNGGAVFSYDVDQTALFSYFPPQQLMEPSTKPEPPDFSGFELPGMDIAAVNGEYFLTTEKQVVKENDSFIYAENVRDFCPVAGGLLYNTEDGKTCYYGYDDGNLFTAKSPANQELDNITYAPVQ